jgi:hypothetical protein
MKKTIKRTRKKNTSPYSRIQGKGFATLFTNHRANNTLNDLDFPQAFVIEKKYILRMLSYLMDADGIENSGGIIFYPGVVDNKTNAQFTFVMAAAKFQVDNQGDIVVPTSSNNPNIEVIYKHPKLLDTKEYVFQAINRCPPNYIITSSDIFTSKKFK